MAAPEVRVDPDRERAELERYLGPRFELDRLQRHEAEVERELREFGNEGRFYRGSQAYLYDLTAFAITQTKAPYLSELTRLVDPGARLLDYGCGIGSDGLGLLEAGYRVEFADFDNPSVAYLRWRLAERGLDAPVHDLDAGVPGGFDAAYAFDVVEHADDPFELVGELERRARVLPRARKSQSESCRPGKAAVDLRLQRRARACFGEGFLEELRGAIDALQHREQHERLGA